ncbi:hypothetical protein ABB37_04638 [Leptomonas pyrrhocoris]|uniref:Uncharacterized protein n=1 Tax=Leptomonas pyrrhocoris TaxID=157538 RepID=A0A0M9G1P5_LEPPY|nr:hypothetical protein ABB37_04638 [Leptomonas pyrrhocoris]KPA80387.1 hypothetical protein ABB37_04638 [Leptomonas pyrrhocoris]|eukprot:XP_015658826.1 hypothetical protein ABB37_04638 [Leptomonas pyrrhocoris]
MSSSRASSPRAKTRASKKTAAHGSGPPKLNLNVQDRRHKTRLENETQRRKDQLLGLTTYDVAAHLHRYTAEPNVVMDESREGCASSPMTKQDKSPTGTSTSPVGAGATGILRASMGGESDVNTRWQSQYAQRMQRKRNTAELAQSLTSSSPSASPRLRTGDRSANDDEDEKALPPPPNSYEEWIAAGCPTGSWAALLQDEVYAPAAAEKALLEAKYDPKGRVQPQLS